MKGLQDAKRNFVFEITPEDVRMATRYDKNYCVIAQAVRSTPGIVGAEVGAQHVRIRTQDGRITRYTTPKNLKAALGKFDKTGKWDLPAGVYILHPPMPSQKLETVRAKAKTLPSGRHKRKNGKPYGKTGRNSPATVNPRVLEFAKMKKETARGER